MGLGGGELEQASIGLSGLSRMLRFYPSLCVAVCVSFSLVMVCPHAFSQMPTNASHVSKYNGSGSFCSHTQNLTPIPSLPVSSSSVCGYFLLPLASTRIRTLPPENPRRINHDLSLPAACHLHLCLLLARAVKPAGASLMLGSPSPMPPPRSRARASSSDNDSDDGTAAAAAALAEAEAAVAVTAAVSLAGGVFGVVVLLASEWVEVGSGLAEISMRADTWGNRLLAALTQVRGGYADMKTNLQCEVEVQYEDGGVEAAKHYRFKGFLEHRFFVHAQQCFLPTLWTDAFFRLCVFLLASSAVRCETQVSGSESDRRNDCL